MIYYIDPCSRVLDFGDYVCQSVRVRVVSSVLVSIRAT